MKILTILGARPQFIKAAAFSAALSEANWDASEGAVMIQEKILHTGQHYDIELSEQIFKQLGIPRPYLNLGIGSMNHGQMTGEMIIRIEKEIQHENPDWVIVFGDTNSTLAGALAAAKLHFPVCHVEAGLRSFDKRMPEEVNRVLTDHVSTLLFAPTHTAVKNLKQENISKGVHHVGDIMYDAAIRFGKIARNESKILKQLSVKDFFLATVHRQENTDVRENLEGIFQAFDEIATPDCPVILPIHPRTSKMLERYRIRPRNPAVRIIPPVPFLDMIMLEKDARAILTDSGGIQKEAYFHRTPCITLRDVSEWVETVDAGWNQLVGARTEKIIRAVRQIKKGSKIDDYGKGDSAQKMIKLIIKNE
jgi:UDP-GlcNAc3NAcA epimerase